MARLRIAALALVVLALAGCGGSSSTEVKTDAKRDVKRDVKIDAKRDADTWGFDDAAPGSVPAGIRLVQTGEVTEPATWATVAEPSAPSPPHAFGVTRSVGVNKTFNLALFTDTSWQDLDIRVALRPTTGINNQGGGVVFRAKSETDHYVARWNPVEANFRVYALVSGARVDIAAADLDLDAKAWHELRVVVQGDAIECFVDDQPVVRTNDKTFAEAGMIGLWTKGDAATLFDDITIAAP